MNIDIWMMTLVALIPILAWVVFFYQQHPEKKSYVVLTFLAGMLSIIPIKLYEKYWDIAILNLENINLFHHIETLTNIPNVDTFLAYVIAYVVVAFLLFISVGLIMCVLEIVSGDNTFKVFRSKTKKILEEPFLFISIGVILGIGAFFLNMRLPGAVWFFVMVGALEEFVKHLVTRFSDEYKIKSVADAVQFSIIAALGFAFVENILYFLGIWAGGAGS